MKSKRYIILVCLFLLIFTIKNVNAEDKGSPIQPDCSGSPYKSVSTGNFQNGIKATYNLGSTALVKMTLATYNDNSLNVIGYFYYADDLTGHYTRFTMGNVAGGNINGSKYACGFVTNNGYSTGCEDVSSKIEIVKSTNGMWFLNAYDYKSFGLIFSASKASAYFSQVENMQKVINTIATGTDYYVDLDNITTENVELINNMILIVEPVYSFSVTMEDHSRENWPYIFTTPKGIAGLLDEDSSAEKHRYSAGINIDDLARNVYALNKYGVINKNNANALIQFDGINVYAAKYAYLASNDNGLGYGIYSLKEFIPKIVEKPDPIDPAQDSEEYVKCPLDAKSTIPNNCNEGTFGSIKEPSVCALLTSANNNSKYNIHTYSVDGITRLTEEGSDGGTVFSRNIATVYCQDTGNYDFYGLTAAYSGRYFEYDVTGQGNYFATYSGEKKCLSVINYPAWKEIYDVALENVRIRYNIWQKWLSLQNGTLSSIQDKSCSGSTCGGGCTGVGGYSYYWSGSYNHVTSNEIIVLKDTSYSSLSTESPSCSDSTSCQECSNVTGGNGSTTKMCKSYCCGGGCSNGSSGDPNAVSTNVTDSLEKYNTAKARVIELENQLLKANYIDNENNSFSNEISNYHTITESKSISYNSNMDKFVDVGVNQNSTAKSVKYSSLEVLPCLTPNKNNYKTICNNEPNVTETSVSSLYRDTLKNKIGITSINIPTNKYAYAITNDAENYYQKNKIYTEVYTGKMSNEARGENWIELKEKVFPLELKSNSYKETLTFSYSSYTQHNNQSNLKQSGTYSCDIIVKPSLVITSDDKKSTQLGYVYRSVDLLDLFPNAKDPSLESYRMPGYNWWDEYEGFVKLKNDIETMEKQQNVLTKTPQYTVVLTPELVDEIKKYNNGRGYSDNSIECKIGGSTNSQYVCQSKFLNSKYFDINTFMYNSNNNIRSVFAKDLYNNFYYYQGAVN